VERTATNDRLVLNVAFNYGARRELVLAVRRIAAEGLDPEAIDETVLEQHLQTAGLPDPDLLIRTSGEMRLSNYLLWQLAYCELLFTDTLWPDFDRDCLREALRTYAARQRRFGDVPGGRRTTEAPARRSASL
jgi:undecaprenyl diphosphate synthase